MTSAHPAEDIRIFHKECVSVAESGFETYLVATKTTSAIVNGVQVVNVPFETKSRLTRMLKASKAVYKKSLELDADVYHFHDPELLLHALKLKRKGKVVIYDAHEDVPRQILAKFWIPKMFRKLISKTFELFENFVVNRIDAVVTSTPYIRDRFLKLNENSMDVCNYPLISELSTPSDWNLKKKEICYVGGLSEVRGISTLMEAMSDLPGVQLNLAGAFSGMDFENQIKSFSSWSQVNFHGFVGRNEILKIFEESRLGLVTLWPTPNHMESLPIKMFEYMSAGIPVICSNFPMWMDIVDQNKCGITVDPKNPKETAQAILNLLENEELSISLGKNGREAIVNTYNWDIEKKKLVRLYNQLLDQKK